MPNSSVIDQTKTSVGFGSLFVGIMIIVFLLYIAISFAWSAWKTSTGWKKINNIHVEKDRNKWYLMQSNNENSEEIVENDIERPLMDPNKNQFIDSYTYEEYKKYNALKKDYIKSNFGKDKDVDIIDEKIIYSKYDNY